ncbi:Amidohydrolase 1 family protein [Desulfonema limicola]|uniref:Amidohydrolase 1 family protein n=1 Tax=Desulfonema limicola TaxID=45656 RepID=A0A975BCF9_9BACT|nr:amidohydrolase family protein [Desulfonema limicola]QTA82912.1 Amidohydrolase 1 family protein [Desulfonema limicola]
MSNITCFINAFLIDGNGKEPVSDASVLVCGDTIKQVSTGKQVSAGDKNLCNSADQVIDLKGKTLMPGLIDAHVHAGNIEVDFKKTAALAPAVYVLRTVKNLETDIDLGFTTLRDAGGLDLGFKQAVDQGLIRGPRLLLSISPLTQTGGHGDKRSFLDQAHHPRNSIGIFPEVCDGPDQVRRSAREVLRKGADQIKVMADGGVASPSDIPGQWQFTVQELKAAVETAQAAGTYVMAHVYGIQAVRNCLEAGVRSIEHGNLIDFETAEIMVQNNAFYVPTLSVFDILAENGEKQGMSPFVLKKLESVRHHGQKAVALAQKAGVKIGSGSDIIGPFQHLKGRELALKAQIMTPMQAIVSATRINAEILGLEAKTGTITPGKLADLIVIDGNPLKDISLFEKGAEHVCFVMKEGVVMKNRLWANS